MKNVQMEHKKNDFLLFSLVKISIFPAQLVSHLLGIEKKRMSLSIRQNK